MMKIDKEKPQILQSTERQHYTKDVVLQESKTDWRSLVMNAPNIITIVGRDGIIHFINHTVSGITIQDVIGNKVYEFVLPEFRDLVKQKIEKVFESGESDYYESAALSPDGSVAWYENYVGPIVTDNKVVAVSLVATDISERRQAEETIRSLAQFPSENHSPVMRVDRDGTLLFANQASAKLLTLWKSIVGEKLPESWRDIVMSAIESGEDYIQEVMCGDRIFSLHITPIEDSDYANIYGHDITELKKAEQTISSLARFPSENRNPVMRVDQEGTILYANDTSAPLLALCSLDEKQQLPNDWRSPVLDAIFNDQPATFEVACDDRIFSLDITPIIKAGYANIYGRDVTEQKNSEILLREQNQFINTVFESLSHPFYVVDAQDYTIKMANTAAKSDEWPKTITCYALTHFRDTPCAGIHHLCPLEQVKRTKQPVITEHVHTDRDGNRRNYEVHGYPIFDEQNNVSQMIEYTLDITERVRAEEALRKSRDELELRVQERTAELEEINEALQAAVVQNTNLYNAEQQARATAETLAAASLALTQTLDLDAVMNTLLEFMHQLVPYDSASFIMPQDETHWVVRAMRQYGPRINPQIVDGYVIDVETIPAFAQMLTKKQNVLIPDTGEYPGWEQYTVVKQTKSWLGVPLISENKIIGICALHKREPGYFSEQHNLLAELLVNQTAVALQNAWLFEQVSAGRERMRALSHRLVEVQEMERRYIARELHDEAGQALSSLMVGLRLLEREAENPESIVIGTAELRRMLDAVMENLHRLAADLRPASLDHLGLVPALRQYVEALSDRHNLVIQFEASGFDAPLTSEVEIALYRIIQEALTNVIRHARASRVDILLEQHDDLLIALVEDNGIGFDFDAALQSGRLGLWGMRERTEMLGGTLMVESNPGGGTTLKVEVPYVYSNTDRG